MRNLELPGRSPVRAPNAMVATSHPLSTAAAIQVLQSGGNAMDAAVTAVAVQSVVEPQSTGIGGDCFVLYAPKGGGDVIAYNGSGRAPRASTPEWFTEQGISQIGQHTPHAVTIPGAVDAWCRLLQDHGTISIADALQLAITYARHGYPVQDRMSVDWARCVDLLGKDPAAASIYLKDGKPYAAGDIHKQPQLAETLEAIASEGAGGFYQGAVAEDIVNHLQSLGGGHTLEDFAAAAGQYVDPIKTSYKGFGVHQCPPNGQGVIALLLLNIMGGMGLDKMDPLSPERLHLCIEAGRMAYTERNAAVSDPDKVDVPVDILLSADFAAKLRDKIVPGQAMEPPVAEISGGDTVYLCVVDKDGNAVSFINSLFQSFGSGITGPKSGVILQNRGSSFNLDPAHVNCIAPDKRPMHTIIPGMLTKDGHAVMPFGVMGGQYQAFGHMYFLSNLFDYGMDLQEAMDLPRLFPTGQGPVEVESGMPKDVLKALESYGHKIVAPAKPIGGSQAIWIDRETGVLTGASDPRKDGHAGGF